MTFASQPIMRPRGDGQGTANVQEILDAVLRRVTPKPIEMKRVAELSERLLRNVRNAVSEEKLEAEVRLDGSVAKGTWLSGEADLDIFIRIPPSLGRDALRNRCLPIARRALQGARITERFADHPYIEAIVEGATVNIVPCFFVEKGMWLSATDRTPFHTEYLNSKLNDQLRGEIRLLKRFMKGIGTYGADIKTGGFSGMLCETLTLIAGSFLKLVNSAASWQRGEKFDIEGYYKDRLSEMADLFPEPLVVIDPVDKGRNIAASVTERRLWEFVAACRAFLEHPSANFFFPKPTRASAAELTRLIRNQDGNLVALTFGKVDAVVDVLWSQLYRTERALRNQLAQAGFAVIRSSSWSNEGDLNLILLEFESLTLPRLFKRIGPPISRRLESANFLSKHLRATDTVAGPWIEGSRWAVLKLRRHVDAREALDEILTSGKEKSGVAQQIASAIGRGYRLADARTLMKMCRSRGDLAEFVANFLKGRPKWLE